MYCIAVDPGPVESGVCATNNDQIVFAGKVDNMTAEMEMRFRVWDGASVVLERITPYSGRVDNNMEETYWFLGHIVHICRGEFDIEPLVCRKSDWARWLTDSTHAKDSDVRMAICNRWADGDLSCYKKGGKFELLKNSDIRAAYGMARYLEWTLEQDNAL